MAKPGSNSNETPSPEDGITFTSSANGARLYCMRVQVYGSFILVVLIKMFANGGSDTPAELLAYESIVIAYLVLTALLYHCCPPPSLRMRMTIHGDTVTLVKYGRKVTVPVASLRRIDIKRSWLGRHRIVRVWDAHGALITLVSPARGECLEWWTAKRAAHEGVPFWRDPSIYLTLEPISTFALTLAIGFFVSALFVT